MGKLLLGQAAVEIWSSIGGDTYQGDFYLPRGLRWSTVQKALKEHAERWIMMREKGGFRIVSRINAIGPREPEDPAHEGEDWWTLRAKFKRYRPAVISLDEYLAWQDYNARYRVAPTVEVVNEAYGKPLPEAEGNE